MGDVVTAGKITKKTRYTPPSKNQTRPTSRRHAIALVVCQGGPFHNDRVRVEILPEQRERGPFGLTPEIPFNEGVYRLAPAEEIADVRYTWEGV